MSRLLLALCLACLLGCPQDSHAKVPSSLYTALLLLSGATPPVGPPTPPSPIPGPPSECSCEGSKRSGDGLGPCPCGAGCKCVKTMQSSPPVVVKPNDQTRIIEFTGEWCGPCRGMEPVLASLGVSVGSGEGYAIRKVFTDGEKSDPKLGVEGDQALIDRYKPEKYPTFIVLRTGTYIRLEGIQTKTTLEHYLRYPPPNPVKATPTQAKKSRRR